MKTEEKFYILIVKQEFDSLAGNLHHSTVTGRSKVYETYKEATEKAEQYIREGRAEKYYVMESKSIVRIEPREVEVIRL
jgi:hypothetical protein